MLLAPPFLACLGALLLNDTWLKHAYPGVLAGKVSDFAGLAVVGLLAAAALPRHRTAGAIAIAAAFAWWKSPLSGPAIHWLSTCGIALSRVVDYTDLVALSVLPLCGPAAERACARRVDTGAIRRAASVPVGLAAALAIMGTSMAMAHRDYDLRPVNADARVDEARVKELVDEVAARHGMQWISPTSKAGVTHYQGAGLWLDYHLDEARGIRFNVAATMNGMFFGTRAEQRADELRQDLKDTFARNMPGLEYVEALVAPPAPRPPCNPSPVPSCR